MSRLRSFLLTVPLILCVFWINNVFADGFIVVPPPYPHPGPGISAPFPLEVKYHRVDVEINDQAATTHIDQEFYNPTNRRLEGHYLFPVPKRAVIKRFSMDIDGKEVEAELLDAKKARKIYEDIVRRQRDPAILEYDGLALFKVRIFPIEPRSNKRIKISYNEILNKDNGTIEYLYPLNTEKFSARPLQDVSVNVSIRSEDNIKNIYCTSHETEMVRKDEHHAIVTYEAENVKPDRDFLLYYNTDRSAIGLSLLTYNGEGEDGFFFLNVSPGFGEHEEVTEKDITFVLDVSGSMVGEKLTQAKKALLFCIENLNKGDRFEIIRFSTEAEALFRNLAEADDTNLEKARRFIRELKAIGGTNIEEALELALDNKGNKDRPHIIVFITDGKPTINETNEDKLLDKIKKANTSRTRIFAFGIGYDLNTHLLDKITEITRAYRTYITPEEDIEIKISNFYNKVQSPVLTDCVLQFENNIRIFKTYPKELPDLFKGSSLTVLGRYNGAKERAEITLMGKVKNKEKRFKFEAHFPERDIKNDHIPSLWAARRIGYLLDQIRLHGEDKELVEETTHLARQYGIVTPYTSYLIIEDEMERVSRNVLPRAHQTLGNIASHYRELAERSKEEFSDMKVKSGAGSVRASREVQVLNKALNYAQTIQGESRLAFKDGEGRIQNLARQVRNIQGRAIYYSVNFWIDSRLQIQKRDKPTRIQFASEEYFELLRNEPQSAQFLALGRNVRFTINNMIYEIHE